MEIQNYFAKSMRNWVLMDCELILAMTVTTFRKVLSLDIVVWIYFSCLVLPSGFQFLLPWHLSRC